MVPMNFNMARSGEIPKETVLLGAEVIAFPLANNQPTKTKGFPILPTGKAHVRQPCDSDLLFLFQYWSQLCTWRHMHKCAEVNGKPLLALLVNGKPLLESHPSFPDILTLLCGSVFVQWATAFCLALVPSLVPSSAERLPAGECPYGHSNHFHGETHVSSSPSSPFARTPFFISLSSAQNGIPEQCVFVGVG